ncbi:hypothetical protein [Paractinoplanes abujensis]|uniref:hypothetical protein n=1 Tax=Paractinoplanes abujensis TaxID=882441 RepID=UPI00194433F6|nr:hypothetical protein [Actinoplanes abujensis]
MTAVAAVIDIPPCTIEAHRIAPPGGDTFVRSERRIAGYDKLSLEFTVDTRQWRLTNDELLDLGRTTAQPDGRPSARLRNVTFDPGPAVTEGQVEDCGEGG